MLNIDPQTGNDSFEQRSSHTVMENPFPGLRPFGIPESHLYFGRKVQVDEVIQKLITKKFVAILGYSGSGKSSLVKAGIIPALQNKAEGEWQILITRPGISPLENMAEMLLGAPDTSNLTVTHTSLVDQLKNSPTALTDIICKTREKPARKTLLIIDQFEELFQYKKQSEDRTEVETYINLILDTCTGRGDTIYLAITMRSDQIGYSARFDGLTNAINKSNYLIPQMTMEEKREAIEGPVRISGASISVELVDQLLHDLKKNQDQLPVLQHALMRTWDYWIQSREENEPIELRHYHAIGEVQEALSMHANEAYNELSTAQKEIAEVLFKSLTEKGKDNVGMRRPANLGSVAAQIERPVEEVIEVVEKFREHSRSFLMPPPGVPLHADSMVEISHESLMRIWDQLNVWVEEEHESAQMYRRLSDAAAMYQIGQTGLWRPPELQLGLNWQKKQKPTYEWARRYDEAYERALGFLDHSRTTFEAEQKHQEIYQKKVLKRTRALAMLFGFLAVVAILFFIFAFIQWGKALEKEQEAINLAQEATEAQQFAEQESERALANEKEARRQEEIARDNAEEARLNFVEAQRQRDRAENQARIAENERNIANEQRLVAEDARHEAEIQFLRAEEQYQRAEAQYQRANELLYRSIAQSMAVKSINVEDNNLKGLLAQQAFDFNSTYGGKEYDAYIYNGLFDALKAFKGAEFNTLKSDMRNSARSIALTRDGSTLFATGTQGKVIMRGLGQDESGIVVLDNRYPNRVVRLAGEERYRVVGSDSSAIQVVDLTQIGQGPRRITGHTSFINDIHLLDEMTFLSVAGDRQLRKNDLRNMQSEEIATLPEEVKVIDIDADGRFMYGGTTTGSVYRTDLRSGKTELFIRFANTPIHAIRISPDQKLVSIGDEKGLLHIVHTQDGSILRELRLHKARISDLEFSQSGDLLVSSSLDGGLVLWETNKWNEIPITMTDNDSYVWDLTITPDGEYLIAACGDGDLRVWPTSPARMAGELCEWLNRNMTTEEWEAYVGNGIPLIETCNTREQSIP
jgi:energy-coupling factor transporter ATP-binding protein EcfA2